MSQALWIPFEAADIEPARRFYLDRLGLSEVDTWSASEERGSVIQIAPGAYLELVSPIRRRPGQGPLAFELATAADVDRRLATMEQASVTRAPGRYPRGHYGFEVTGPDGVDVMVWTEDRRTGRR
ncbi:VOC family protein [Actinokineospora xionganensis]|uniref:VOC family protein n=1 Tax=Actinokineospora xionganensis TaxID=2684470 RepID=A0ABR7L937_9PSEU|nr:VOC family protein [Actinokineospora xionganensis]MBC6448909.1 VOC family protein [Actinokineospora xionganensis]